MLSQIVCETVRLGPLLLLFDCGSEPASWHATYAVVQGPMLRRPPMLGLMLYCCFLKCLSYEQWDLHFCTVLGPEIMQPVLLQRVSTKIESARERCCMDDQQSNTLKTD